MDDPAALAAALRRWIEALTMRSMYTWRRFVKGTGLSVPQFGVLVLLYHGGPCDMRALREHLEITSAGVSQLVDRLVQGGLVARSEDPGDRRMRQLDLTPAGCALVEQSISERFRWVDELLAGLGQEERSSLSQLLPALIAAERRLGGISRPQECPLGGRAATNDVQKETP